MHRLFQPGLIGVLCVLAIVLAILYWAPKAGAHYPEPERVLRGSALTDAGGHTKIYISPTDAQWDAIDDPDWEVMMANYDTWYANNVTSKVNDNLDEFAWTTGSEAAESDDHGHVIDGVGQYEVGSTWYYGHRHINTAVEWQECRPGFDWKWYPDDDDSPVTVVPDYCSTVYYDGYNSPQYGPWDYVSEVNWSGN